MEEKAISASPSNIAPDPTVQKDLRLARLPEFVTPDWLRENHHLMKADLRRLATALGKDYADWPSTVDGSDEAAFWEEVCIYAQRWTWFLWLLEDRIFKLFGRTKGPRKQLAPRILASALDRAKALQSAMVDEPKLTNDESLEVLWNSGEQDLVVQLIWVLVYLPVLAERPNVTPWLKKPEIDRQIGAAVAHVFGAASPEHDDLVERLLFETNEASLEKLITHADDAVRELSQKVTKEYDKFREYVAREEDFLMAEDLISETYWDVEGFADEIRRIAIAQNKAMGRYRFSVLGSRLLETLEAIGQTRFAKEGDFLTERVKAILGNGGGPLYVPQDEWDSCQELANCFHTAISKPGQHEQALREASLQFAENPSTENRERLHAVAMADSEETQSIEPAVATLDKIDDCLTGLIDEFGRARDRVNDGSEGTKASDEEPERKLQKEIDELQTEKRKQEQRIAELEEHLREAANERDGLRREKHRLQQRIAVLKGSVPVPLEDEPVPELNSYADLTTWTETHFRGRVALAGRAVRAIKSASFEDVSLVGKAIELLGTTYHRMRTEGGKPLREVFDGELRELRLQETPSLSRGRQGMARDDFSLEWSGRKLTLDRHLKNNAKTRDPKLCFRLYFAWDDESSQVVIGHLPGHLKV